MKPNWRLLAWQRRAILDAYLEGEKIEAISAEFGVSKNYPHLLARRAGHPTRGIGRPKSKQSRESVLASNHSIAP